MKKGTLATWILGTIGGIALGIGMCMCLIAQWGAFVPGVILGGIGAIVLLAIWPVYRKLENKPRRNISLMGKAMIGVGLLGIIALGIGLAMCLTTTGSMVPGIVLGCVGLVLLLSLIPMHRKATYRGAIHLDGRKVVSSIIGIVGALVLGFGMSRLLIGGTAPSMSSLVIGIVGLVVCILNYPVYRMLGNGGR